MMDDERHPGMLISAVSEYRLAKERGDQQVMDWSEHTYKRFAALFGLEEPWEQAIDTMSES